MWFHFSFSKEPPQGRNFSAGTQQCKATHGFQIALAYLKNLPQEFTFSTYPVLVSPIGPGSTHFLGIALLQTKQLWGSIAAWPNMAERTAIAVSTTKDCGLGAGSPQRSPSRLNEPWHWCMEKLRNTQGNGKTHWAQNLISYIFILPPQL